MMAPGPVLVYIVGAVVALPLVVALYLALLIIALLLVLTGIAPVWHARKSRAERSGLLSRAALERAHPDLKFVVVRGRTLCYRFTEPAAGNRRRAYSVCMPNGMGNTMAMLGRLHDRLVAHGFAVLSFDRYGCGFSDANVTGTPPTVDEALDDMHHLMCLVDSHQRQQVPWILVGASMGSIVAQAYIAKFPETSVGFLNLDGLPHPFHRERALFSRFGAIYRIEARLVWTGLLRLAVELAGARFFEAHFASATFPTKLLVAQASEFKFFDNIASEMPLMMDLAESASRSWGAQSVDALSDADLATLLAARPTRRGDESADGSWREEAAPAADDAATEQPGVRALIAELLSRPHSPLCAAWQRLVVRVMGGRSYPYPLMVYTQRMRDWAGAEHALHHLLAADGGYDLFPRRAHNSMFAAYASAVRNVEEIADVLDARGAARPQPQPNSDGGAPSCLRSSMVAARSPVTTADMAGGRAPKSAATALTMF